MSITKDQAVQIVTDLLKKSHSRFKQELNGENEDLDRVIRQYRTSVSRVSWKASQKWCKWNDEGPVLMPDNTRIYYRKGSTEVLVKEYAPQIRLMKFKGELSHRASTDVSRDDNKALMQQTFHYSLALPYLVFMFKFVDGMFDHLKCAFSDRPLQSLDERPLKPYISNIDNTLKVCLGASFDRSGLQKDNVYQQSSYILSYFWQAVNSDEWASLFWENKKHFQNTDSRLATMEAWQEASAENSLFVIEDVQWLKFTEESFGDMIVRLFEEDKSNLQLHEEIHHDLTETFLKDITKTFNENIDAANEKTVSSLISTLADELMEKVK